MKLNRLTAQELNSKTMPVGEIHDGGGLYLRVTATGNKAWIWRYRHNGKSSSTSLGSYPQVTLAKARTLAGELRAKLKRGVGPKFALQTLGPGITFGQVKDMWFERIHKEEVKPETYEDGLQRVNNHAHEIMGMPLTDITPQVLVTMFEPLRKKQQFETIKKVADKIRAICNWAVTQDMIKTNPAQNIKNAFPKLRKDKKKPLPFIRADQLHRVFEAMFVSQLSRQTKDLLMCFVLSALRAKELTSARWDRLHGDRLTILAADMKNGADFDVYLSAPLKAILKRQPKKSGCPYIFPHRNDRNKHATPETITKWLREAGFRDELVTHGFRKMFSTWANEQLNADETNTLYPVQIIERCLDHQDEDKIRAIYNGAIYPKLRMAVMQGWADYVGQQWQIAVQKAGAQLMHVNAPDAIPHDFQTALS